jgi:hypothetical protein
MSNDNTIIFAALAVGAAYYMTKPKAPKPPLGGTTEIFTAGDAHGWRYFSDGTAISPDGTYYKGGEMIWNPMM